MQKYSSPLSQCLAEPHLAAITAASLLGCASPSFAHPDTEFLLKLDWIESICEEQTPRQSYGVWFVHSITRMCFYLTIVVRLEAEPLPYSQVFFANLSFIFLYFKSTRSSLPAPPEEKHPHGMMLPPPCFTVGMLCWGWCYSCAVSNSVFSDDGFHGAF